MVKVSIIVPVYNVEDYLDRCINSVINQTYDNIELILVNDGSTDRSGEICDSYSKKDQRIKVIHKENGGVSSARNVALKTFTGEYLMFLDGDDALDLNAVECCVRETDNAFWDIVLFGFHMFTESDGESCFQNDVIYKNEIIESKAQMVGKFSEYYRKGYFNFITDKIIKSSLIKECSIEFKHGFNIGGEDGMFMLDIASNITNMKITSDVFYQYYRRCEESVTQLFKPKRFDRYYDRVLRLYEFMIQENCLDNEYLTELYGTYFLWAYESTFYQSCKFNLIERFEYVRTTFKKRSVQEQRKMQKQTVTKLSLTTCYSRSSLVALNLFFHRRFVLLGIWNVLTYFKMR